MKREPAGLAVRKLLGRTVRRPVGRVVRKLAGVQLGVLRQHDPRPLRMCRLAPETAGDQGPLPSICIVTPVLNQGRFIRATVDSVLSQGYGPLEYVVKDAASSDDTLAVVKGFGDRIARVISAPDRGQSDAINIGFDGTSSELMAYLNADDLLLPNCLQYVGRYFRDHPEVDAVYGHRVLIDDNGDEIGRWVLPSHSDGALRWADFVPQETLFWRRRLWERVGGVDASFRFAMDWDLLLRFIGAGARVKRLPYFLGAFRVHESQKTSGEIHDTGKREMDRILEKLHGRPVTMRERHLALIPYVARHIALRWTYRVRGWA